MIVSRWILLKMGNMWDKSCRENQNTNFIFNKIFFLKSCRLWDNVKKYGEVRWATNDVTIWRIRISCWISKATCTHTHAHVRARARTRARAHTYIHKYVIFFLFFHGNNASLTRLIVTLYVHCLSCCFCRLESATWGIDELGVQNLVRRYM